MLENYLKLALKVLLRRKFFTFISLFGISFTLVVLLLVTAVFDNTFGAVAPESRQDRTLCVTRASLAGDLGIRTGGPGYALLERTIRDLPGAEASSIITFALPVTTHTPRGKFTSFLKRTDAAYWRILEFTFVEGGPFSAEDDRSAAAVAVINETTRERYFDGEPAVGRSLRVGERNLRIVGVVEDVPINRQFGFADVWVPLGTEPSKAFRHEIVGNCLGLVLARHPNDFDDLIAEFKSRVASVEIDDRNFPRLTTHLETAPAALARIITTSDDEESSYNTLVIVFTALGLLFMALPAINLVNINLSRIAERASEIGVRRAFGASSATLVGQFVIENLVLTIVGGVIALGLSALALSALNASGLVPYSNFRINTNVFAVALAATLFFGLASGVYPAWRMSRLKPVEALAGGAR